MNLSFCKDKFAFNMQFVKNKAISKKNIAEMPSNE